MNDARYVTFSVGDYRFAVPVATVHATTRVVALESVPGMHPSVRGIFSLRGECVYCIDLAAIFLGHAFVYSADSRLIVLADAHDHVALFAEKVLGVIQATHTHNFPGDASAIRSRTPLVCNVLESDIGFLFELDVRRVLRFDLAPLHEASVGRELLLPLPSEAR